MRLFNKHKFIAAWLFLMIPLVMVDGCGIEWTDGVAGWQDQVTSPMRAAILTCWFFTSWFGGAAVWSLMCAEEDYEWFKVPTPKWGSGKHEKGTGHISHPED